MSGHPAFVSSRLRLCRARFEAKLRRQHGDDDDIKNRKAFRLCIYEERNGLLNDYCLARFINISNAVRNTMLDTIEVVVAISCTVLHNYRTRQCIACKLVCFTVNIFKTQPPRILSLTDLLR